MARQRKAQPSPAYLALVEIEPELHHVRGLGAALTAMGETADSIEPIAISSVARSLNEAVEKIADALRAGFNPKEKRTS